MVKLTKETSKRPKFRDELTSTKTDENYVYPKLKLQINSHWHSRTLLVGLVGAFSDRLSLMTSVNLTPPKVKPFRIKKNTELGGNYRNFTLVHDAATFPTPN